MESDNRNKLKVFFNEEYNSLKNYTNSRIKETASRSAEDIIQDVAVKLFAGADRYAPINNVAGFVYRSIRNRIIDVMRSNSATEMTDNESSILDLEEFHQSTSAPSEEMIAILKSSISQLKPQYRDIIIAIDFEGYTYKEIALETGIPLGTLMSRRHRAIAILYKKLNKEFSNNKNLTL